MGKVRVLLAEDDPDQTEVLTEYLSMDGYEVLVAATDAAVRQELLRDPDVVLLDLNGVASPSLLNQLAERSSRPEVIVVSADVQIEQAAKRLRARGWLAKPYDLDDLDAALASATAG
jgi:two-component system, OmpR family, response regulator QseB